MASFADTSDLTVYYDSRRVRELCSDTGVPIAEGDLATNAVALAALARATEMVLMAVRQGDEYSEDELQTLADDDDTGAGLRGLVCDLAFGVLVMRRGIAASDQDRLSPAYRSAQQTLQLISAGELIFPRIDGEEHADAGKPRAADLTQQATTPLDGWAKSVNYAIIPSSSRPTV